MPATMYYSPIQFINQLAKQNREADPQVIFETVLNYCHSLGIRELPAGEQSEWKQYQQYRVEYLRALPAKKESVIK